MSRNIKNLNLFKKILLFSFFISSLVVISAAGVSYLLQSKQLKDQMIERVRGLASLWSVVIDPEDVKLTAEIKQNNDPAAERLTAQLTLLNEKNSSHIGGYLMLPELYRDDRLYMLAMSGNYRDRQFMPPDFYDAGPMFLNAFNKTVKTKTINSTDIYSDDLGTWITALAPIKDKNGELVAVLGIDLDASIIKRNKSHTLFMLLIFLLVITSLVYIILKWGLKKVFKPVDDIFVGINEVTSGNFNVQLPVHDESDLGDLTRRFNEMTTQLSILFERLSAASSQLSPARRNGEHVHLFEQAIDRMEDIFQRTKIQQELQRAEKMNAIGQLAASVAHEIRNPMTVVKGFLQIFLAKDHMSNEEHMYIKLMIDELNRAETIINDYLSLAKPDLNQSEDIDGADLAENVMDLMSSYAMMSKNINLKIEINDDITIKGNVNELKQVLINILKNGIEAMKDGGTLSLAIEKSGSFAVFSIKDTGVGMTKDEISRLGTAFYSLKERGTGMGLMVCYQIIERMRGRIEVKSKKGEGTTFQIYLPLSG
ncbi:ATP-binding protein [Bacillus sp. T33-2]|uniref:ATP-binding protein n=1 Tax=Bacillus sp. T33-2 TaxID=2054168 RepID=UPI000C7743A5|nr:ATP-binding protein [Bacillus sp. T33-2]PLR98889.1 two-component sensor histidine kinase [Bacillus sp. T33-2]